ncbi:MAG TPA: cyclase family protein [Sporichthyaceae bacterium]|nr:cyclase family protein [Sporichthyaceae bacterium]
MTELGMRLLDLTHPVHTGMPVWPGDPQVLLRPAARIATHGYNLLELHLGSQSGTHVEAPSHVDDALPGLDELPLHRFIGEAVVADLRGLADGTPIGPAHLATVRERLAPGVVLLLCTGWSVYWGSERYAAHPWLDPAAAELVVAAGVRTVGIDASSIDATDAVALPSHHVLAAAHAVIAENLTGLPDLLVAGPATVWLLPLALAGAEGSPVRAVARVTSGRA